MSLLHKEVPRREEAKAVMMYKDDQNCWSIYVRALVVQPELGIELSSRSVTVQHANTTNWPPQ